MRDDHLLQIVLIVSGDTEEVQLVALLVVSDLEQGTASLQPGAERLALTDSDQPRAPLHPRTHVTRVWT